MRRCGPSGDGRALRDEDAAVGKEGHAKGLNKSFSDDHAEVSLDGRFDAIGPSGSVGEGQLIRLGVVPV